MLYVRSILFNIYFGVWIFFAVTIMGVFLPFDPKYGRYWSTIMGTGVFWGMEKILGIKYEIVGLKNLPKTPFILASKHQSVFDTLIFQALFPKAAIVHKKELEKLPIFGKFSKKLDMISVDRSKGTKALRDMQVRAKEICGAGRSIVIFPEGTRTLPDDEPKYQRGVAMMYEAANVPVMPVALNSGMFWGAKQFLKKPGLITIEYLPEIPAGLSRDEFMVRLQDTIESNSKRLMQVVSGKI